MALRNLHIGEMLRVSKPFVTEGDAGHEVIVAAPELVGVLPSLVAAHQTLYAAMPPPPDERAAKLQEQAGKLDADHDSHARWIYTLLSVGAEMDPSGNGPTLLLIRDTLFPDGLRHTQRTYRDEAGHAERTSSQLTAEQWTLLGAMPFAQTTVKALVEHWAEAAKKLGEVEKERARIYDAEAERPAREREAKSQWIRAINALITMAELAELSEADDVLLFNELRDAEARADKRKRGQEPEQAPTPEEPNAEQEPEQAATPATPGADQAPQQVVTPAMPGAEPRQAVTPAQPSDEKNQAATRAR